MAGHPRSGNTWLLRVLSDFLLSPIRNLPPDTDEDRRFWREGKGEWVIVKTHWKREQWDGKGQVVFIHRDPRDMVISMMYYRSLEPTDKNLTGTIHTLGEQNAGGYLNYIRPWLESDVPTIRYEWLHEKPVETLARLSYELVHHMPTMDECLATFERVSFKKLNKMEPHEVRKGIVGDWEHHFKQEHGKQINELMGDFLLNFGYVEDENWWTTLPI